MQKPVIDFIRLRDTFQMKTLHPSILLGVYITIAQGWLVLGDTEQALDILTQYTDLAVSDIYPIASAWGQLLQSLDEWFDSELMLGSFPPRDETLIRHSMTQALSEKSRLSSIGRKPTISGHGQ